jgi:hypothetical protein
MGVHIRCEKILMANQPGPEGKLLTGLLSLSESPIGIKIF